MYTLRLIALLAALLTLALPLHAQTITNPSVQMAAVGATATTASPARIMDDAPEADDIAGGMGGESIGERAGEHASERKTSSAATPSKIDLPWELAFLISPKEAIQSALKQVDDYTSSVITHATALSTALRGHADKIAFGLGIVTLTLAGLRFAATQDAVAAWTELLETILVLGIFASIYAGYEAFAPALFNGFNELAKAISGDNVNGPAMVLAEVGSSFLDALSATIMAAPWAEKIPAFIGTGLLLLAAFLACLLASVVYTYYIMVGKIQAAIGIVVGPIAVALAFSEYTRRYFMAWLDFMIGACMYVVVAAAMAKLVASAFTSLVPKITELGGKSAGGATYALVIALFMLLLSFELPKMAASMFGSGGGATGGALGGVMGGAMIGLKLARQKKK